MEIRSKKLAIITGGSKGIGAAIARKAVDLGLEVLIIARGKEQLSLIKEYLEAEGGTVHALQADLTKEADIERIVKFAEKYSGQISALLHNAAVAKVASIQDMELADWQDTLQLNVTAPFYLTKLLTPLLPKKSKIIFINSVAGKQAFSEWGAYCASKYALRALAETLRQELADSEINVTTIYPGSVDTPLMDAIPYDWDRDKMLKATEVAEAVAYCLKQPPSVRINDIELENSSGRF